ncbi:MAG: NAD-dependent epimerase/dehydratase family protein [Gemmatimonadetes bacterium]|nr:NAD-dependent epimerase/dehydratase family protein [Gemmatimonadota bacterium]
MRVLVIGGTQFMGRETVRRLMDRGHNVWVLHRRDSHDLGPEVGNLQADRGDLDAMSRLLGANAFEAVFDFAYDWEKGTTAEQVEGAARACTDSLQRYVFISSVAAYGGGVGLAEDAPLAPDDFPNPYVQHKASSERALFRMHETTGFPVTTFRPPFVHGPRQMFYREQFFWDRLRDGRPIILPDDGSTPMQWVFARDVAEVCARAIEVPAAAGEAFNVAHKEPLTQRTFVEALGRTAGIEPAFVSVPREAIIAAGGQMIGNNLYYGEYLDLPPLTTVVGKVERILGFTPTPLDAALRATFEWYLSEPRRPVDYAFEDKLLVNA